MKIIRPLFVCACAGTLAALFTAPLHAQQAAPAAAAAPAPKMGSDMVTLPDGWKVISRDADAPPAPNPIPASNTDPRSVTLLLSASPADAKRGIALSLYSTRFYESAPAPAGAAAAQAESAQFLRTVLAQGYTPTTAVQVDAVPTARNQPLVTLTVTGKNGAGDERVFTDSTVAAAAPGGNTYHLCTSRPASDAAGAQEIAGIIKSLNVPANAANPGAVAVATNPAMAPAQQQPGTATTPGANASQTAAQIVQDYHNALIVIEGDKGLGSGFICKMDGKNYMITNAHVLADNSNVKLTGLDGTAYVSGSSAVAVEHDIVRMEVAKAPKAFEVMENLDANAKIGDAVMIPGNAEGEKVVTAVEGKIVGIGPNLVEVDAPFVPGNSGSPIVHVATGKVLGVATYLSVRTVGKGENGGGKVTEEVRRFGYRLDSVKQWQPINWQVFYAESAQVAAIEDLSDDFIHLFDKGPDMTPADCKSPALARVVRDFIESRNQNSNASRADQEEIWQRFLSGLRATTQGDIANFNARPSYDYFRRRVAEQAQLRTDLFDFFSRLMQNQGGR